MLDTKRKRILMGGIAALAILGVGTWVVVSGKQPTAPAAEQPAAEAKEGGEAEGEEGVIALTAQEIQAAGITIVSVGTGGGAETRLAGRVEPMIDAKASVAAAVGGRIERVLIAPGQSVRVGQPLVVMVSGDAASLSAEVAAAQAAAAAAQQAHERDENLADMGVVSRREAEIAHAEALSAQATARAARARATAAGAPNASGRFNITSPISGVVTSMQVGPGGFAAQGTVVAEVINPARVEVVFSAPSNLATTVSIGSAVKVTGPQGEFEAVVSGVAAGADMASGATLIRARATSGNLPPAGSAVTGSIITSGSSSGGMTVPSEAVQTVEGNTVVFVQTSEGFKAVPVLVGRQASGRSEILRGLTGNERIASTNAFLLKAEMAKGEAEHGH